ncbi:hypothetical protein CSPX01_15462 [Colletotrichum filicis]|nr:hypothetical protein CSPX01_15462 [Colletotrichum filicis]
MASDDDPNTSVACLSGSRRSSDNTPVPPTEAGDGQIDRGRSDGRKEDGVESTDKEENPLYANIEASETDEDACKTINSIDQWKKMVNSPTTDGSQKTPLHIAAEKGFLALTRLLIEAGANVDALDVDDEGPISFACMNQHIGVVRLLCENKASVTHCNWEGWYPIHWAINNGDWKDNVIPLLLGREKECINKQEGICGWTPLNMATYRGRNGIVETLLREGADPTIQDEDGWTPVMTAAKLRNSTILGQLLIHLETNKKGENVGMTDNMGKTVLKELLSAKAEDFESPNDLAFLVGKILCLKNSKEISDERHPTVLRCLMGPEVSANDQDIVITILRHVVQNDRFLEDQKDDNIFGSVGGVVEFLQTKVEPPNQVHFTTFLLCWLARSVELHGCAQKILEKYSQGMGLPQLDIQPEKWKLAEWAIYCGLPQVLMNCVTATRLVKGRSDNDKPDFKIDKPGFHDRGKARDNQAKQMDNRAIDGEEKGEGEEMQALRDMEDILDFYLMEETIKPKPSLKMPKNDVPQGLENFEAAVIQIRQHERNFTKFVKFRKISEVIYEKGSLETVGDTMERFGRYFATNGTKDEVNVKNEGLRKATKDFTWIHLPSTNDIMKNLMVTLGCDQNEFKYLDSFLRASWVQIPDKTSPARYMQPQYARGQPEKTPAREAYNHKGPPIGPCAVGRMPRSNWTSNPTEEDEKPTGKSAVNTTKEEEMAESFNASALYSNDANKFVLEILDHIRRRMEDGTNWHGPESPKELSKEIVEHCTATYERKYEFDSQGYQVDEEFLKGSPDYKHQQEISASGKDSKEVSKTSHAGQTTQKVDIKSTDRDGSAPQRQKGSMKGGWAGALTDGAQKDVTRKYLGLWARDKHIMDIADDKLQNSQPAPLTTERLQNATKTAAQLLFDIKDVRDELNIMKTVAESQLKVHLSISGTEKCDICTGCHDVDDDSTAEYNRKDIIELDKVAEQIQDSSPLSFMTSLFALDVAKFLEAPVWSLVTIRPSLSFVNPSNVWQMSSVELMATCEDQAIPSPIIPPLTLQPSATRRTIRSAKKVSHSDTKWDELLKDHLNRLYIRENHTLDEVVFELAAIHNIEIGQQHQQDDISTRRRTVSALTSLGPHSNSLFAQFPFVSLNMRRRQAEVDRIRALSPKTYLHQERMFHALDQLVKGLLASGQKSWTVDPVRPISFIAPNSGGRTEHALGAYLARSPSVGAHHAVTVFAASLIGVVESEPLDLKVTLGLAYWKAIHVLASLLGGDHAIVLNMTTHCVRHWPGRFTPQKHVLESAYQELLSRESSAPWALSEKDISLQLDYLRTVSAKKNYAPDVIQRADELCRITRDISLSKATTGRLQATVTTRAFDFTTELLTARHLEAASHARDADSVEASQAVAFGLLNTAIEIFREGSLECQIRAVAFSKRLEVHLRASGRKKQGLDEKDRGRDVRLAVKRAVMVPSWEPNFTSTVRRSSRPRASTKAAWAAQKRRTRVESRDHLVCMLQAESRTRIST